MNRRNLLTAVGSATASIAGCTSSLGLGLGETLVHEIAVVEIQETGGDISIEFDIDLVEHVLSDEDIPLLEFTISNMGDGPVELTDESKNPAFPVPIISDPDGLWLPSESSRNLIIEEWVHGEGSDGEPGGLREVDVSGCVTADFWVRDAVRRPLIFQLGEERTERFGIVGRHDEERACPAEGEYSFETTYTTEGKEFTWGFTFGVSES